MITACRSAGFARRLSAQEVGSGRHSPAIMATPTTALIPVPEIQQRIHVVRGKRVMLDADLAGFTASARATSTKPSAVT